MGIAFDVKFIDFLMKLSTGDVKDMPLTKNMDDNSYVLASLNEDITRKSLINSTLSAVGVERLYNCFYDDMNVNLAGMAVLYNDRLVFEKYKEPYKKEYRHVSFSMCKSVMSMAVGIAVDKGLLSIDEKLVDIFPEYDGLFLKKANKELKVCDLLKMTTGVAFDEVESAFEDDWRKSFINSDISHLLDNGFSYNSLNTYMLAAIIVKKTNQNVMTFLNENLFSFMNITDITWDKCPMGIEKGGFGMKLSLTDMIKLGQLYLNDGVWIVDGSKKQLISKEWIKSSTKVQVELDRNCIKGYGYQIWILNDNSILFNGVFGQNVYINKKRNIVIATTAAAYDIFPDGVVVERLIEFAGDDANFCSDMSKPIDTFVINSNKMCQSAKNCYNKLFKKKIKYREIQQIKKYFSMYLGKEYEFKDYLSSIIPMYVQGVYSLYSGGIDKLSIGFKKDKLFLKVKEGSNSYVINLGYCDSISYEYQILEIGDKKMPIAACGRLKFDEDGRPLLKINIHFLEEVGTMCFKLIFKGDKLIVKANDIPSIMKFGVKLKKEEYIKKKKPKLTMKKSIEAPDYMKYKVNRILSPVSTGRIVE